MIIEDDDPPRAKARSVDAHTAAPPVSRDAETPSQLRARPGNTLDDVEDRGAPPPYNESSSLLPVKPNARPVGRLCRHVLLFAILSCLLGGFLTRTLRQRRPGGRKDDTGDGGSGHSSPDVPTCPRHPDPRDPRHCIPICGWAWNLARTSAVATFEFEADDVHAILASGNTAGVFVVQEGSPGDSGLQVRVTAFHSKLSSDLVEACYVENGTGLEIKAGADDFGAGPPVLFRVVLSFPVSAVANAVRQYAGFKTRLPRFEHQLGALQALHFGKVSVQTSSAPIAVQRLNADDVLLHTAEAAVRVAYISASTSFYVYTSNAEINIRGEFWNDGGASNTSLGLHTINGSIFADAILRSAQSSARGGAFDVRAITTLGVVEVEVRRAPVDSRLALFAYSFGADICVALPAAYDGHFLLDAGPKDDNEIVVDPSVQDPAGGGRRREVTRYDWSVSGDVAWMPRHEGAVNGSVLLQTTAARTKLLLK